MWSKLVNLISINLKVCIWQWNVFLYVAVFSTWVFSLLTSWVNRSNVFILYSSLIIKWRPKMKLWPRGPPGAGRRVWWRGPAGRPWRGGAGWRGGVRGSCTEVVGEQIITFTHWRTVRRPAVVTGERNEIRKIYNEEIYYTGLPFINHTFSGE